jgi:phage/plasmid-like protein (TIGR03299 family)
MAHRLSIQNGSAEMAYTGDTPWHGLGTKVDGLQTAQEMLRRAGLLWTVSTRPLVTFGFAGTQQIGVDAFRAIARDDNDTVLGVASERYHVIQNTQAGDMMDALVTEGGAHVEVAGALDDGQRCWMLAHIPADFEVVSGDLVKPYMLLAWGHDGKHGLAGKLTTVRVVCNNTLTAAGFGARGQRWKDAADVYVRHSANATVRIDEAQRALGLVRKQVEATADAYRALAQTIPDVQARAYFASIFQAPDAPATGGAEEHDEKLARWTEHQAKLLALYEGGAGHDIAGVRGTAWAAYNSVTEFTDHVYPVLRSGEVSRRRQESVLFGAYGEVKARALREALALVG